MPQQFFLTADPAPYIPATWRGGWDNTSDAVTVALSSVKATSDPTKHTIQRVESSESSDSLLHSVALVRLVSGRLAAQTISGTMQLMVGVWQSDVNAELYFHVYVYVTAGDNDVVRATLVKYFEPTASGNVWPIVAKARDLQPSVAIASSTILDGDRIVIELGYVARNIVTTTYAGAMYYGTDFYTDGAPDMEREA